MQPDDEKILRITKEIVVKFIELGRVSPSNFDDQFKSIFWTVKNTVVSAQFSGLRPGEGSAEAPKPTWTDEEEE